MTAAEAQDRQYYDFGPFRLALDERRLYRHGKVVLLPPKEFDLLLLLVRNSGRVVNREILIKALWPDTVVEEANLNVHISALRKALADQYGEEHQGEQYYIETLPRLGYRFVTPILEVRGPEQETPASPSAGDANHAALEERDRLLPTSYSNLENLNRYSRRRSATALLLWLVAFGSVGVLAFFLFKSPRPKSSDSSNEPVMNVVPLTTYPGRESQAAFSPDGNQIAFAWAGEKDDNSDIYVRMVGGGNWVRLTTNPGDDLNPVWSPDARTIAFYRTSPDGDGVFLMSSLGGAERKIADVWTNRFGFGIHTWLNWSPDGKWLVLSDKNSAAEPFSIYLVSLATGERRRLTTPPATVLGDCSPALSPDGKQLAFVRVVSAVVGEVYVAAANGGEPKRLTFDGGGISNLAWAPDGREIVFSSRTSGSSRLFRISVDGGPSQWLAAAGSEAQYPAFSPRGNRLAWTQDTSNADIYRVDLKNNNSANPGKGILLLISSTAQELSPRYSPDGARIVFVSSRSGNDEIWVCDSDGQNPVPITSFSGTLVGSPSWSPDGKQIAFDARPEGNADIFTISANGGQPHRLTSDPSEDIVPSWSRDGGWIYFSSNRAGRLEVWKLPTNGGDATRVTKAGFEPVQSPDGQWLYFSQDRGLSSIWRAPVAGGEEEPVFDFHHSNYGRMWDVESKGIFFAITEPPAKTTIKFYDFSSGNEKAVTQIDGNLRMGVSGLTVSPDGRWLLLPLVPYQGSDIMMIDGFR